MDVTLDRIISLIPKKPNGNFSHGAKKDFAVSIGFKSGEIISDWIAGRSKSYHNYLYQISDKYDVSVEWLQGKTDIKERAINLAEGNLSDEEMQLIQKFRLLPVEIQSDVVYCLKAVLSRRGLSVESFD